MKEGLVEKEERAKMVGCSPLALKKLFTGKEPDCWLLRDIYLNRLKKKKRNGRCQLDNKIFRLDVNIIGVLVDGHLSQEQSYNTLSGQIGFNMVLIES